MNQWWTLLLIAIMHVQSCLTAVATLPLVSSETKLDTHVQNSSNTETSNTFSANWPDDVQLGCKELRAKRFISDGFCTSLKAIKEAVCAGHCMPIKEQNMPWWAEFTKYWAKPKFKEWRCVEAVTKLKKVQLQCENGETRIYKIKIVKSCRCKSYEREPNRTEVKGNRGKRQNKDKDRKDREKKRREREERKRLRIEQRLARKKDNSKGKVKSSHEARRHRHNHRDDDGGGRREIPSGKNTGISESQNSNSHIISNNESPSV